MKKFLLYLAAAFSFLLISNSAFAQAPAISYTTPVILATNQPFTITPNSTGGAVTSWAISPTTLPTGMTFSAATGVISGTPTTVTAAVTYTITATGTGTGTATLVLSVAAGNSVTPVFSYSNPNTSPVGVSVSIPVVNNSNAANTTSYTLTAGTLPTGLTLNAATGTISGTPTTVTATTTVTISANTGLVSGTTTVTITITIAPPIISYPTPPVFTVGTTITSLTPTNTGGLVATGGNVYGAGKVVATDAAGDYGMAVDASGDVFMTNILNNSVTEYSAAGAATTTNLTGIGAEGPIGLVFDASGNAYVLEQTSNSVVEYVGGDFTTTPTTIITGLSTPTGIAIGPTGNLYVANSGNGTITEYAATGGAPTLTITANTGGGGFFTRNVSGGIAVDASGNVYVVDNFNFFGFGGSVIDEYNGSTGAYIGRHFQGNTNSAIYIDPIAGADIFTTQLAGFRRGGGVGVTGYTSGFAANITNQGGLSSPRGVVYDAAGDLFVSDYNNGTITEYPVVKGYTISGTLPAGLSFSTTTGVISGKPLTTFGPTTYTITAYNAGGSGTTTVTISCVANPPVISYTPNPAVFVNPVVTTPDVLPITASATPPVIASGYTTGTSGSTGLTNPWGVTKDPITSGDIWVVNNGTNTIVEYNAAMVVQKTVTITGATGLAGVTTDAAGNLYVSSTGGTVYKVTTPAGNVTVTAAAATLSTPGGSLDGITYNAVTGFLYATNTTTGVVYQISTTAGGRRNRAQTVISGLSSPTGITVDASGNIYVLGLGGTLKEYSSAGVLELVVPLASSPGSATYGLYIDGSGDIYISDSAGKTVKEYNTAGTLVATIATTGTDPRGLVTDATINGDVYVADHTSNTVTEYTPATYYTLTAGTLPPGVTFSSVTGTFSIAVGAAAFGPTLFTVTAYGSSGTATTQVTISCTSGPIISYTTPDVYPDGTLIAPLNVVSTGSVVVNYVSTPLPPGLSISATTGQITGTPTTATPATAYVVTATDAAGKQGTFTITITTLIGKPIIAYPTPKTYPVGVAIATLSPTNTGGAVSSSYTISGLPAGLSIDPVTGNITGTPTTATAAANYTVTVSNAAGTATFPINITIVSGPIFTYPTPEVYVVGTAITPLTQLTNTGSAVVSYSISPGLPAGLSISPTTGVISGTPTAVSTATNYVVTGTDALGNKGTFTVNITVNDAPPVIIYLTPQVYTVGTTITPLSPTVSGAGEAPTGYVISGLPAGLSIDPLTGIITGTPTAATGIAVYTVTATNDGGTGLPFGITITVNALGPVIAYTTPDVFPINVAITPLTPVNSGSTPLATNGYSITAGSLPTGLSLNVNTGAISGTPTVAGGPTTVTITATDGVNTGSTIVSITCAAYDDWIGINSTVWSLGSNWSTGSVPGAAGIAAIGVNQTFKNQPIVTASTSVGAIVIGTSSTVGVVTTVTTATPVVLTVNTLQTLTVTGAITYQSDANSGLGDAATITGAGNIAASGINVNATTALAASYTQTLNSSVTSLTLSSDVSLTTSQTSALITANSMFNITGGTVSLTGKVQTSNSANATSTFKITPAATATLAVGNVAFLSGLSATGTNVVTFNTTGTTINYANTVAGVNQTYYTDAAITGLAGGVKYNSIKFSGLGVATANGTSANFLFVNGNFTDQTADATNNYVNLKSPTVIFNGTTQSIIGNSGLSATTFYNVDFTGTLTATISGYINVASSGVLTMLGTKTLATGGVLELHSDVTGSATVATIPATCSITGSVFVDRFLTGGLGYRGYRLLTSPVHVGATNLISMNYLINSCYMKGSGGTAGGFDGTGNPNLYLYRENLVPVNTTFTGGNYRGVATLGTDLFTTDSYTIDIDGGPYTVPIGDGYLFFFRGDKSVATLAQETALNYVPTSTTLQAYGTLNQGSISASQWYSSLGGPATGLGFTTTSGLPGVEGFNLVGNPYASSIDWDTYNTTTSGSGIYATGGNVASFAYIFNVLTQNYDVYSPSLGGDLSTSGVPNANIIPSGQGFFVIAGGNTGQLQFNESAKTNTQATAAIGNLFLGTPAPAAVAQNLRVMLTRDSVTSKANRDGIVIIFNKSASANYSRLEDAPHKAGSGTLGLACMSADSVSLTVNSMPFPTLQTQKIPLTVTATTTGLYQLNFTATKSIPALYTMWLKDAYKQDSLDIRANPIYSFNIDKSDPASFGANRFSLVMSENPALMVHLLNFNATKATGGSQVVWKTENEQNYTNFTVQRSIDGGVTFAVLGGYASSAQGTYSFLDANPAMKANQYRLMIQDLNGTISYSKVVTLIYGNGDSPLTAHLNVYPNPSADVINVSIPSSTASNSQTNLSGLQTLATTPGLVSTTAGSTSSYDIKIISITGSVLRSATSASTNWQGSVSGLAPGTYIIQVINNSDKSLVGRNTFVKL